MDDHPINKTGNLKEAILRTLAFFDIFDYPLTLLEIYKWLYRPDKNYKLSEIREASDSLNSALTIGFNNGFYFLPGRELIVETRLRRYCYAEQKFQLARRVAKFLRGLAFVEMVAVCNNAGYNNATKESDIDFFIIVNKGWLWWSRFIITLIVQFLGLRRHGRKITNRICLSFYITDDHLNLQDIMIDNSDPYLVYWLATLSPIYDRGIYWDFIRANGWINDYLPNFYPTFLNDRRRVSNGRIVKLFYKSDQYFISGGLGKFLDRLIKKLQLGKMKRNINSLANLPDNRVIINDTMLKFHEGDKREIYRQKWQEKLNNLGV